MYLILSYPRVFDLVRQLEGLHGTSDDELMLTFDRTGARLRSELHSNFGILTVPSEVQDQGTLFMLRADLSGTHGDRVRIFQGLSFLGVLAVTIEASDLRWLYFGDQLTVANLERQWSAIQPHLERVPVDGLMPKLAELAASGLQSRPWSPEIQEHGFDEFLRAAGKTDPMEHFNKVDAFRREEEQRYQITEREELIAGGFNPNNW
jgi:hypothetical protein